MVGSADPYEHQRSHRLVPGSAMRDGIGLPPNGLQGGGGTSGGSGRLSVGTAIGELMPAICSRASLSARSIDSTRRSGVSAFKRSSSGICFTARSVWHRSYSQLSMRLSVTSSSRPRPVSYTHLTLPTKA